MLHAEAQSGEILGVICQLGGQTPLGLAKGIEDAGYNILGTSPSAIDLAEERGCSAASCTMRVSSLRATGRRSTKPARSRSPRRSGTPVLVRPSFVLGGRGMEIVYDTPSLRDYFVRVADQAIIAPDCRLVDRFLDDAVEIDVDALYDGHELYIGGVMEHLKEAGIHSGDSSCTLPPISLGRTEIDRVRAATTAIAEGVGVRC